jgi:hypothetical protein
LVKKIKKKCEMLAMFEEEKYKVKVWYDGMRGGGH